MTCRRCHQRLRRPLSLARGYGPVCWHAVGKQLSLFDDEPTLAQIAEEARAIRQQREARARLEERTR
jgi:hypothetical protein